MAGFFCNHLSGWENTVARHSRARINVAKEQLKIGFYERARVSELRSQWITLGYAALNQVHFQSEKFSKLGGFSNDS